MARDARPAVGPEIEEVWIVEVERAAGVERLKLAAGVLERLEVLILVRGGGRPRGEPLAAQRRGTHDEREMERATGRHVSLLSVLRVVGGLAGKQRGRTDKRELGRKRTEAAWRRGPSRTVFGLQRKDVDSTGPAWHHAGRASPGRRATGPMTTLREKRYDAAG